MKHFVDAALEWLAEPLVPHSRRKLDEYERWLGGEGVDSGGIGSGEAGRIEERHIVDSLTFAAGFPPASKLILDIGSGVGLPGIPLAILRPLSRFVLLDRSQRRTDLAARAVRILGLDNVDVVYADINDHDSQYDAVVMRAALKPRDLPPLLGRLLEPEGSAVVGLSRRRKPAPDDGLDLALDAAGFAGYLVEVPVLDSPTWLLNMKHRVPIS